MTTKKLIVIEQTDPRRPEVRELVAELDAYMQRLYPAESNHLLDVESLAQPEVLFFVGRVDGESLACGAIVLRGAEEGRHESGEAYAEVKRIYVSPRARGLGLGKKLLSHLEDAARAHRLHLICLETGVYQPEALGLFAHHGFARCRHFGDYPPDDP